MRHIPVITTAVATEVVAVDGTTGSETMRKTTMNPCTTTDPAMTPPLGATTMIEVRRIAIVQAIVTEMSHAIGHLPRIEIEAARRVLGATRADLQTL